MVAGTAQGSESIQIHAENLEEETLGMSAIGHGWCYTLPRFGPATPGMKTRSMRQEHKEEGSKTSSIANVA